MKKILFAGALFAISVGTVFAYFGNHSFGSLTNPAVTNTSDGHTYTSDYQDRGNFPYNGSGVYDGSKVNLTGIYTVYSDNGTVYNPPLQYCVKTSGNINRNGLGKLQEKVYSDLNCTIYLTSKNYSVKKYTEDGLGNFTLIETDGSGVTYTTTGIHSFAP